MRTMVMPPTGGYTGPLLRDQIAALDSGEERSWLETCNILIADWRDAA
jgi:hypothetical protein